jgi:hypothetical protein
LALGVLVPVAVLVLAFWRLGILGRFWFWTFDYARAYVSEVSLGRVVPNLVSILGAVVGRARWLWLIAAIGVPCLWIGRWPAPTRTFVLGLLLTAFLAVCPGWYFRPHYFVLMLPAVALLVGVAVVTATERARWGLPLGAARFAGLALFATVVLGAVWAQRDLLFAPSAVEMTRRAYPGNPFVEAVEVARYVRARTSATDRIAVLGSEPEIYFYAGRRSATGYIYMYPFFEPQPYAARMQDEMVRQIETARPRYLVFVQCDLSWGVRRGAPRTVLDWAWRYDNTCYRLVGLVDSPWSEPPRYVWGTQAASYSPVSSNLIFVYERRSDAPCAVGDGG